MRGLNRRAFGRAIALGSIVAGAAWASADDDPDDGSFGFTKPIVCKEINGYEDYVPLAEPALTPDEKLLVYFLPRHYKTARVETSHEAHLTQDGRIRRKGEKAVIWSKSKLLEYHPRSDEPPRRIYLRNTISLKILKPGEYEYDIILRDEIGRSAPAVRSVPFRVVAPKPAPGAHDDPGGSKPPPGSKDRDRPSRARAPAGAAHFEAGAGSL